MYMEKKIYIRKDRCMRCGACTIYCPVKCIKVRKGQIYYDEAACTGCGRCINQCFMQAIKIKEDRG